VNTQANAIWRFARVIAFRRSQRRWAHPFAALIADETVTWLRGGKQFDAAQGDLPNTLSCAGGAARSLSPEQLLKCTLYTNGEPCCMCFGAIYWCNIGRVVYAMSRRHLLEITGDHPPRTRRSRYLPRYFARGKGRECGGPLIEDEARSCMKGFGRVNNVRYGPDESRRQGHANGPFTQLETQAGSEKLPIASRSTSTDPSANAPPLRFSTRRVLAASPDPSHPLRGSLLDTRLCSFEAWLISSRICFRRAELTISLIVAPAFDTSDRAFLHRFPRRPISA